MQIYSDNYLFNAAAYCLAGTLVSGMPLVGGVYGLSVTATQKAANYIFTKVSPPYTRQEEKNIDTAAYFASRVFVPLTFVLTGVAVFSVPQVLLMEGAVILTMLAINELSKYRSSSRQAAI